MSKSALLSVDESVEVKLVTSGLRDQIKQLARERLDESGWTDEVRQLCREYVSQEDVETVTHADIVQNIQPQARAKVPDHVKAELLKRIKEVLEAS